MATPVTLGPLPGVGGGTVKANAWGDSAAAELVLTVHGQNPALLGEWEDMGMAPALAEQGYYVRTATAPHFFYTPTHTTHTHTHTHTHHHHHHHTHTHGSPSRGVLC